MGKKVETGQPYSQKLYGIMKEAYGDKFTHTPESFDEKISNDPEYQKKIYGVMKDAYGDKFTHTPESFVEKLKGAEPGSAAGSGQGSNAPQKPSIPSGEEIASHADKIVARNKAEGRNELGKFSEQQYQQKQAEIKALANQYENAQIGASNAMSLKTNFEAKGQKEVERFISYAGVPGAWAPTVNEQREQIRKANEEIDRLVTPAKTWAESNTKKMGPIVNELAESMIGNDVGKFTMKSKSGHVVVNPEVVDEYATRQAAMYGLGENSSFKKLLYNTMIATVDMKMIEPRAKEIFSPYEKAFKKEVNADMDAKFTTDEAERLKYDAATGALFNQIQKQAESEALPVFEQQKKAKEQLQQQANALNAEYNARLEELNKQFQAGAIPLDQYKTTFDQIKNEGDAKIAEIQKASSTLYDQATTKLNEINSRYQNQYKQAAEALKKQADARIKQAEEKFLAEYQVSPEKAAEFSQKYSDAYKQAAEERMASMDATERQAFEAGLLTAPFAQLGRSFMNGFGGSLKALATSMDIPELEMYGDYLAQKNMVATPKSDKVSDLFDLKNLMTLTGQLGGGMTPSILASTTAAMTTGGLGMGASVQMLAASVAGFTAESADIAGRAYNDAFERSGGNVAKAKEAAQKSFDSQLDIMWAYAFEGLPFISKGLSMVPTVGGRMLVGGGIELSTELIQETLQNIAEKNISEGRNAWEMVDMTDGKVGTRPMNFGDFIKQAQDTFVPIAPVAILGMAGQVNSTGNKQEMVNAITAQASKDVLSNVIEGQSTQFVYNTVFNKGSKFTKAAIDNLFTSGQIDKAQRDGMIADVLQAEKYQEKAKALKLSPNDASIYSWISSRADEALAKAAQYADDPVLAKVFEEQAKDYQQQAADFINGKDPEFFSIKYADGSEYLFSTADAEQVFTNPDLVAQVATKRVRIAAFGKGAATMLNHLNEGIKGFFEKRKAAKAAVKPQATDSENTEEKPDVEALMNTPVESVESDEEKAKIIQQVQEGYIPEIEEVEEGKAPVNPQGPSMIAQPVFNPFSAVAREIEGNKTPDTSKTGEKIDTSAGNVDSIDTADKKADIESRRKDIISRKSTPQEKFEFLESIPEGTIFKNEDGDALIVRKKTTKRGTESYQLIPLFLNENDVWEENTSGIAITEKRANGEYNVNAALPQIFTSDVEVVLPTDAEYDAELAALEGKSTPATNEITNEDILRTASPIGRRLAEINNELSNLGYKFEVDMSGEEFNLVDSKGNIVDKEDIPDNINPLVQQFIDLASRLEGAIGDALTSDVANAGEKEFQGEEAQAEEVPAAQIESGNKNPAPINTKDVKIVPYVNDSKLHFNDVGLEVDARGGERDKIGTAGVFVKERIHQYADGRKEIHVGIMGKTAGRTTAAGVGIILPANASKSDAQKIARIVEGVYTEYVKKYAPEALTTAPQSQSPKALAPLADHLDELNANIQNALNAGKESKNASPKDKITQLVLDSPSKSIQATAWKEGIKENPDAAIKEIQEQIADNEKGVRKIIGDEAVDLINETYGRVKSAIREEETQETQDNEEQSEAIDERSIETVESDAESAIKEAGAARTPETVREALEKIEAQINAVGKKIKKLTEVYTTDDIDHEIPSYEIGKKAKREITSFMKDIAQMTGWEIGKNGVRANIAPAGGDVYVELSIPGTPLTLYAAFKYEPEYNRSYDNYTLSEIFYRVEDRTKKGRDQYVGPNQRINISGTGAPYGWGAPKSPAPTSKELATIFAKEAIPYVVDYINKNSPSQEVKDVQDLLSGEKTPQEVIKDIVEQSGIPAPNVVIGKMPKPQEKPAEKPTKRQERISKIKNKDLDDLWGELGNEMGNLNAGLNPKQLEIAVRIIAKYAELGILTFAEVAEDAVARMGEAIIPAMKAAYMSFKMTGATPEQKKQMDSESVVDEYEFNAEQNDQSGETINQDGRGAGGSDTGINAGAGTQGGERGSTTGGGKANENNGGSLSTIPGDVPADNAGTGGAGTGNTELVQPDRLDPDIQQNFVYPENWERTANKTFSKKQAYEDNIAALEIIDSLLDNPDQFATDEQKEALSKYNGLGPLSEILLDDDRERWNKSSLQFYDESRRIISLLDSIGKKTKTNPLATAKSSTRSAYYTSLPIIRAMWEGVTAAGFTGGRILEGSVGSGRFIGGMPKTTMSNSRITGVDMDVVSALVSKYLYPNSLIKNSPIERASLPSNSFDLFISNIPFGKQDIYDPVLDKKGGLWKASQKKLHTYFFAKAIDVVRPGGYIAILTTANTLDTRENQSTRDLILQTCEFVGAVRLGEQAFNADAGTQVVTDIILLRKRQEPIGLPSGEDHPISKIVKELAPHNKPDRPKQFIEYNEYFAKNKENVFGEKYLAGGLYSEDRGYTLTGAPEPEQVAAKLQELASKMPIQPYKHKEKEVDEILQMTPDGRMVSGGVIKKGGKYFTVIDYDKLQGVHNVVEITRLPPDKDRQTLDDFINLKNLYFDILSKDRASEDASAQRVEILDLLNSFVKRVKVQNITSLLSGRSVISQIIQKDPDAFAVLGLIRPDGKFADVVYKSAGADRPAFERTNNPADAIAYSINAFGHVNVPFVREVMDLSSDEEAVKAMGDLVFETPDGSVIEASEYLSGNVREKLDQANEWRKISSKYDRNAEALSKVIPDPIPAEDITFTLGAGWIPVNYYQSFLDVVFGSGKVKVTYSKATDKYNIVSSVVGGEYEALGEHGTKKQVGDVIEAAFTKKIGPYFMTNSRDDSKTPLPVLEQSVRDKVEKLQDAFSQLVVTDPTFKKELAEIYNRVFNGTVIKEYSGSTLTFPGLQGIELRPHQKDAVMLLVQKMGGMVDHIVGAGKTLVLGSAAIKMKQMGLVNKPVICTMKSVIPGMYKELTQAYPGLKILAPKETDFSAANRQRFFSQVANNDWDLVIISHENLGTLTLPPDFEEKYIQNEIEELMDAIAEIKGNSSGERDMFSKKQLKALQEKIENMTTKLNKLQDKGEYATKINMGDMGLDMLFIDESQEFKNLAFHTGMRNVSGLGNPAGSNKAANLKMICRYLQYIHSGDKGVCFASGTPISNSLTELYNIFQFIRPSLLKKLGMNSIDQFINTFGIVSATMEKNVAGVIKSKTRLNKFVNVTELATMYTEVSDIRAVHNLQLPRPKIKGGKPEVVLIKQSESQRAITDAIYEASRTGSVGPLLAVGIDVPDSWEKSLGINLTTLGSKASIDPRMVFPKMPEDGGKIQVAADKVYQHYIDSQDIKGTQLIFSDLGVPKDKAAPIGKRVYDEMVERMGEESIAEYSGADAIWKLKDRAQIKEALVTVFEMSPSEAESVITQAEDTESFSVYAEMKKKLVRMGIPENEIAFIHDAPTKAKKEELFLKVNNGEVRVLIGSTKKMGTGVNVQRRVVAMHHLDAQWRPSDMEQRNGRGIRQGNMNEEVAIYYYGTEETIDAYRFGLLAKKQAGIDSFRAGGRGVREMDFEDGESMTLSEIAAAISGDTRLLDIEKLGGQIRKFENRIESAKRANALRDERIKNEKSSLNSYNRWIDISKEVAEIAKSTINNEGDRKIIEITVDENGKEKQKEITVPNFPVFTATVSGKQFDTKSTEQSKEFYKEIANRIKSLLDRGSIEVVKIGEIGGIEIVTSAPSNDKGYRSLYLEYKGKTIKTIVRSGREFEWWTILRAISSLRENVLEDINYYERVKSGIEKNIAEYEAQPDLVADPKDIEGLKQAKEKRDAILKELEEEEKAREERERNQGQNANPEEDLDDAAAEYQKATGDVATITDEKLRAQIDKVVSALKNVDPGARVVIHNDAESYASALEAMGEDPANADTSAAYDPISGEIHLNVNKIGDTTLFHEAAHPIMAIMIEMNPELLDGLYSQIESDPALSKFVAFGSRYADPNQQKKEAVIEFLAAVAAGKLDGYKNTPLWDKIKAFFNSLIKFFTGKDTFEINLDNVSELKTFAGKFAEAVRTGTPVANSYQKVVRGGAEYQLSPEEQMMDKVRAAVVGAYNTGYSREDIIRLINEEPTVKQVIESQGTIQDFIDAALTVGPDPVESTKEQPVSGSVDYDFNISGSGDVREASVAGRAMRGMAEDALKQSIEKMGFDQYHVRTAYEADIIAQDFIDSVGMATAFKEAVVSRLVPDDIGAIVIAKAMMNPDMLGDTKAVPDLLRILSERGTNAGRGVNIYKYIYENYDIGFDIEKKFSEYRTASGDSNIPELVEKKWREYEEEMNSLREEIKQLAADKERLDAEVAISIIKENIARETSGRKLPQKEREKISDRIRKAKLARPDVFNSASPAVIAWDTAVEIVATTFDTTQSLAQAVKKGIDYLQNTEWYKSLNPEKKTEAIQKFADYYQEEGVPEPYMTDEGNLVIPNSFLRSLVAEGYETIEDITEQVRLVVDEAFPDYKFSEREVRDAITGYGRTIEMASDDISKALRKAKNIGRIISGLEDVQTGLSPLRSGLQREPTDPDIRLKMKELREAMKDLPVDQEASERQLKTALDAIKTRLTNAIQDIEREIETGMRIEKSKRGVAYDQTVKDLKERLAELRKERDALFGEEMSQSRRINAAIRLLDYAIESTQKALDSNDLKFKSKEKVSTPEIEAKREVLKALQARLKEARKEAGVIEAQRLANAKKNTEKLIQEYERRLREKDYAPKKRTPLVEDTELARKRARLRELKDKVDQDILDASLRNFKNSEARWNAFNEAWNLPKTVRASLEFSPILIQGGPLTMKYALTQQGELLQAIKQLGIAAANESTIKRIQNMVKDLPWYTEAMVAGLELSEFGGDISKAEEGFVFGALGHKIYDVPVGGAAKAIFGERVGERVKELNPMKVTERGASAYLNYLRIREYERGRKMLLARGYTIQNNKREFENLAKVINTYTGRGAVPGSPKYKAALTKGLSYLLFSAKNWSSVIKQTTPIGFIYFLQKTDMESGRPKLSVAQRVALENWLATYGTSAAFVLLFRSLFGGDDDDDKDGVSVSLDPRSSDFAKIKVGDTRVDPWGGRSQMLTFQARMYTQEIVNQYGETVEMGEYNEETGRANTNWLRLTYKLFQGKLHPTAAAILEKGMAEKNKYGQMIDEYGNPVLLKDQLTELFVPMYIASVVENYQEQSTELASVFTLIGSVGVSTNTYGGYTDMLKKETLKLEGKYLYENGGEEVPEGVKNMLQKKAEIIVKKKMREGERRRRAQ